MKITVPIWCVKWVNVAAIKNNKYSRTQPCKILIQLDETNNRWLLEFSGKILGDSYPSLINKDTFLECLNKIEDLRVVSLDKEGLMAYGEVLKCDVTCDICYSDADSLVKFIKANLANYNMWGTTKYPNGVVLRNNVTTSDFKQRLVIYNKEKELQRATNKAFLISLEDKESLQSYFNGKLRLERNLMSKKSIRKALNIKGNSIYEVLNSTATPIAETLKNGVKPFESKGCTPSSLRDFETWSILKVCDFDLTKVEAKFREVKSKNTRMSRIMPRFQEYVNRTENFASTFDFNKLIDLVS